MLKELLKDFNLSEEQINKLNRLRELCLEYNEHTNLTSIVNEDEFNKKHILDSLAIIDLYDLKNKDVLDVGTGGGFPGVVLAIAIPESNITMIDSNNKKIKYLNSVVEELKLNNTNVIYGRIEESNLNEKFDFVVSRAVANLNILLEITAFSAKSNNGTLVFYKGNNFNDELSNDWSKVSDKLGVNYMGQNKYFIDDRERSLLIFSKFKPTNKEYPRHFSKIKKTPIY